MRWMGLKVCCSPLATRADVKKRGGLQWLCPGRGEFSFPRPLLEANFTGKRRMTASTP